MANDANHLEARVRLLERELEDLKHVLADVIQAERARQRACGRPLPSRRRDPWRETATGLHGD